MIPAGPNLRGTYMSRLVHVSPNFPPHLFPQTTQTRGLSRHVFLFEQFYTQQMAGQTREHGCSSITVPGERPLSMIALTQYDGLVCSATANPCHAPGGSAYNPPALHSPPPPHQDSLMTSNPCFPPSSMQADEAGEKPFSPQATLCNAVAKGHKETQPRHTLPKTRVR